MESLLTATYLGNTTKIYLIIYESLMRQGVYNLLQQYFNILNTPRYRKQVTNIPFNNISHSKLLSFFYDENQYTNKFERIALKIRTTPLQITKCLFPLSLASIIFTAFFAFPELAEKYRIGIQHRWLGVSVVVSVVCVI